MGAPVIGSQELMRGLNSWVLSNWVLEPSRARVRVRPGVRVRVRVSIRARYVSYEMLATEFELDSARFWLDALAL